MITSELTAMLDMEGEIWLLRPHMTIYDTLRAALQKAQELSQEGQKSHIVLLPEDRIVITPRQIDELWAVMGPAWEPMA